MAFLSFVSIVIAICLASLGNSVAILGPQGGVNTATGQRPFRQDFSTFKNSGPAFDLYILSLQQFQQQNQSALLSYYQVGGKIPFTIVQRTDMNVDQISRHSWAPLYRMGWRPRIFSSRILHAQLHLVPLMASTLRGTLRGSIPTLSTKSQISIDIE